MTEVHVSREAAGAGSAGDGSRVARRLDKRQGIIEEARFIDCGEGGMFVVTHLPLTEPVAGVVICSSLYAGKIKTHRLEVAMARQLAASGIAVERFDYFGLGHSDGLPEHLSFESMQRDTEVAVEHLRRRIGDRRIGLIGTGFGALTAAGMASVMDAAPVALISPPVSANTYFREALMARGFRGLLEELDQPTEVAPIGEVVAQLKAGNATDILGFTISGRLYNSSAGKSVMGQAGDLTGPVLMVVFGEKDKVEETAAEWTSRWEGHTPSLTVEAIPRPQAWWYLEVVPFPTEAAIEAIVPWLRKELSA